MVKALVRFAGALALSISAAAAAQTAAWEGLGAPVRAQINGGPWTLGQGPATQADPTAGFPAPNPGLNDFAPDYQGVTFGDDQTLQGFFDYRPENLEEAILAASSSDRGLTWTFQQLALDFNPNATPDVVNGDGDGQGHPYVLTVGGATYLYTFDRQTPVADIGGLLVHALTPTSGQPLAGAPAAELPVAYNDGGFTVPAGAIQQTSGLLQPDAILGVVPGASPIEVVYLQKQLGAGANGIDLTTLRLATTTDGINFADQGAMNGLTDATTIYLGPKGTLLAYPNGTYGLFFSGGVAADGDSDSFHYIGYAESSDLSDWTVYRGVSNPLAAIDGTDPFGAPQAWYAGRVYAPSVTVSPDGCTGTLIFSGYATQKVKKSYGDYRQVGQLGLTRTDASCAGPSVTGGVSTSGSTGSSVSSTTAGASIGTSAGASSSSIGSSAGSSSATSTSASSGGLVATSASSSSARSSAAAGTSNGGSSTGGTAISGAAGSTTSDGNDGLRAAAGPDAGEGSAGRGSPSSCNSAGGEPLAGLALIASVAALARRRRATS